jgi:hypothetical protein
VCRRNKEEKNEIKVQTRTKGREENKDRRTETRTEKGHKEMMLDQLQYFFLTIAGPVSLSAPPAEGLFPRLRGTLSSSSSAIVIAVSDEKSSKRKGINDKRFEFLIQKHPILRKSMFTKLISFFIITPGKPDFHSFPHLRVM